MKSIVFLRKVLPLLTGLAWVSSSAAAAVPPAEQLLPSDTLLLISAPDWTKVVEARSQAPFVQLWNDPAMRPFRDKLVAKITTEVLEPLERQAGIKLADYAGLMQGQLTLALTQNGWTGSGDPKPGFLLLLDARAKADLLKTNLAEIKKKLADNGSQVKLDKIRDVEFTTVTVNLDQVGRTLQKVLGLGSKGGSDDKKDQPDDAGSASKQTPPTFQLSFAQVDTLLLAGTSAGDLEKVLVRLSGGSAPALVDQAAYDASQRALFRDAVSYLWINFGPVGEIIAKQLAATGAKNPNPNPIAPQADKIVGALGLTSLKTVALAYRQSAEGASVSVLVGAPEDKRKGLFKIPTFQAKEAGPPPFVPADAVQYNRWRVDGQKAWASLEAMISDISPGMLNFLVTQVETALKQKDPNFDFRKNLVANLGDDLITYQKAPRGNTLADLGSPPNLVLLGTVNPEQFLQALKSTMILLPGPMSGSEFKEREFLGRKIYTLPLPTLSTPGSDPGKPRNLYLAASGGYVAITTDTGMIEEYLRSSDTKPKPLQETPGLTDAAQKVGGTVNGLFGYQNDTENMRALFETVKTNPDLLSKALAMSTFPLGGGNTTDRDKTLKEWLDFSLLPTFDKVAKYFFMTVYAGRVTADGFDLRLFTPTPPQSRP